MCANFHRVCIQNKENGYKLPLLALTVKYVNVLYNISKYTFKNVSSDDVVRR